MYDYSEKIVVITGTASGIGKCLRNKFTDAGATVCSIDIKQNAYAGISGSDDVSGITEIGDIADPEVLSCFADKVISKYGRLDLLINNAMVAGKGIDSCEYDDFLYALRVGVAAPFMLTKLFKPYFTKGSSIINISSSRDRMSQPQTESYSSAKGGISALTHATAASLSGIARVNSISPGWIDTTNSEFSGADALQHTAGRVGKPEDIAELCMFLASDKAGFINGENICIDGGMTKYMIYHDDGGWVYNP